MSAADGDTARLSLDLLDKLPSFLARADAAQLKAFAEKAAAGDAVMPGAWELIFARWAELDPQALIAFGNANTGGSNPMKFSAYGVNVAVWQAWARYDFKAAAAAAIASKSPGIPRAEIAGEGGAGADPALLAALRGEPDPAELAAVVKDNPAGLMGLLPKYPNQQDKLLKTWAESDPAAALAWARSAKTVRDRQSGSAAVFEVWAKSDPAAAAAAAGQLPAGAVANEACAKVAAAMASTDPKAAADWARSRLSGVAKTRALAEVLGSLGTGNPTLAREILEETGWQTARTHNWDSAANDWKMRDPKAAAVRDILKTTAATDPGEALRLYTKTGPDWTNNDPSVIDKDMKAVLADWIRKDPAAALHWAETSDPAARAGAIRTAQETLGGKTAAEAQSAMGKLPSGPVREALAQTAGRRLARENPDAALTWAGTLTGADQDAALRDIVPALADRDGAAGLAAAARITDAARRNEVVSQAVMKVAGGNDPDQLPALLAGLPEGLAGPGNYQEAAAKWAGKETRETSQWIDSLPPGASRDAAIGGLLQTLVKQAPEDALVWAATVDDPAQRTEQLQNVAKAWRKSGVREAAAGIASSALPEPDKNALLEFLAAPR